MNKDNVFGSPVLRSKLNRLLKSQKLYFVYNQKYLFDEFEIGSPVDNYTYSYIFYPT